MNQATLAAIAIQLDVMTSERLELSLSRRGEQNHQVGSCGLGASACPTASLRRAIRRAARARIAARIGPTGRQIVAAAVEFGPKARGSDGSRLAYLVHSPTIGGVGHE